MVIEKLILIENRLKSKVKPLTSRFTANAILVSNRYLFRIKYEIEFNEGSSIFAILNVNLRSSIAF